MFRIRASNDKKKALLAKKERILQEIDYYEKRIEEFPRKNSCYYFDGNSSDSDDGLPAFLDAGPSIDELKRQHRQLETCLQATQELTSLIVLQSEVNILVQEPTFEGEKAVDEPGCWREVVAECRIDVVPFSITFYTHQPSRKFAAASFRGLRVLPVKAAQEAELSTSVLAAVTNPSDAVEVLRSYSRAHRSRRSTLGRLVDSFPSLFVKPLTEGGFLLKCANLVEISWRLESKTSPLAPFHHKLKFELEYIEESYLKIIRQVHRELSDPCLQTDKRTLLLAKIINTCLEAEGALSQSMDSDQDLRKHDRTTMDDEPAKPRDEDVMAPPKAIPKKAKPKGKENKDENRKTIKRNTQNQASSTEKKTKMDDNTGYVENDDVRHSASGVKRKAGDDAANKSKKRNTETDEDAGKMENNQRVEKVDDKTKKGIGTDNLDKNQKNLGKDKEDINKKPVSAEIVDDKSNKAVKVDKTQKGRDKINGDEIEMGVGAEKIAGKSKKGVSTGKSGDKTKNKEKIDNKTKQDKGSDEIDNKVTENIDNKTNKVGTDKVDNKGKKNTEKTDKAKQRDKVDDKIKKNVGAEKNTNKPTPDDADKIEQVKCTNKTDNKTKNTDNTKSKVTDKVSDDKVTGSSKHIAKTTKASQDNAKNTENDKPTKKINTLPSKTGTSDVKKANLTEKSNQQNSKINKTENLNKNVANTKNYEKTTASCKAKVKTLIQLGNTEKIQIVNSKITQNKNSKSSQNEDIKNKDSIANVKQTNSDAIVAKNKPTTDKSKLTPAKIIDPAKPDNNKNTKKIIENNANSQKITSKIDKLIPKASKNIEKSKLIIKNHRNSAKTLKINISTESGRSRIPKKLSPAYAVALHQNPLRISPRVISKFKSSSDTNIQWKTFNSTTNIPRLLKPATRTK